MRSQEVTIEELKGGLRNKEDEVEAIVEARDSEIGTLKALVDIRNDEINGLEETQARTRGELELAREERERLQLRYNELGLSLASVQEELEEARTLAGANKEATAAMARQIEVLIEDQSIKRNDLESLRKQLDASIDSARDAQARLRSATDRQDSPPAPAPSTGTPLARPTATPMSRVTTTASRNSRSNVCK